MDEYTLTLNVAQLEALAVAIKTHRDHLNQVLDGVHQLVAPKQPASDPPPQKPPKKGRS